MKLKKPLFLAIFVVVAFFLLKQRNPELLGEVTQVQKAHKDTKPVEVKKAIGVKEAPTRLQASQNQKHYKEITQDVLKDFLEMEIPTKLPESRSERYKVLRDAYLKTSFFLNEVAAGNLSATRDRLLKAFRMIHLYLNEVREDGSDLPLGIIQEAHANIFQEALQDLNEKERETIEELLL